MKLQVFGAAILSASLALGAVIKRDNSQFKNGQPIDGKGKGAPILGMSDKCIKAFH
jgi:oxalate decarboxylase